MKNLYYRTINSVLIVGSAVLLAGCNGGGSGSGSAVDGTTPLSGAGGTNEVYLGGPVRTLTTEESMAVISNPEPATALLIGGGLMAYSYYKKNRK